MKFKRLINSEDIQSRVNEIAADISKHYDRQELTIICVLKGSLLFTADLVKNMDMDINIEFMRVSSYKGTSREEIKSLDKIDFNIENKNILIVEDIVDSGNTINFIVNELNKDNPKSIKIASLLFKPDVYNFDMKIDWIGFNIKNEFVVGYGMDYNEKFRNKKSIDILIENE
tara:strand:+ start:293 stop:808 length:516 start_codon:yes stop_codon:yes gene_type:complete